MEMRARISNLLYVSVVIIGIIVYALHMREQRMVEGQQRTEWRNAACPSLFSIARSWRDSLIVMKMVPECNQYIIETFQ
jgi:hypothetical protein